MTAAISPTNIFHMSLVFRTGDGAPAGQRLAVTAHNMLDLSRHDGSERVVVVWGTPAKDGRILNASEIANELKTTPLDRFIPKLDSSFLLIVYERQADQLRIVSDRFGSLPLFHQTAAGQFLASTSFKRLFDARGAADSPGFDPWTVIEFFYFRRVFNTRSYDSGIAFMPGGGILTITADGSSRLQTWWRIKADKLGLGKNALGELLADALRSAMQTAMSDGRKYGLLLSGGLDARALLAAAPEAPVCFTTTPRPNNELAVAEELARLRGAEHVYIPRPERLLDQAIASSVALSGGMTIFNEVPFLGYGEQIAPRADTVFMGLALDIMFCGHYLPKSLVSFGGRHGWHFRLHELKGDLSSLFADTVSYRLKTTDPMRVIRPEHRAQAKAHVVECVRHEMDEGRAGGLSGYDLWEFTHLRNMARHYSLLMAQSVRTFAACRVPAFSNRLYDLCWQLRAEDKFNWAVYQAAIKQLNPELMRIRNANTNIRADVPLQLQTALRFAGSISSRVFGTRRGVSPSWWDRSWPEPRQSIDVNPAVQAAVRALPSSSQLAAVGLFDPEAIGAVVAEHIAGTHDHTVMLNELVTIDRALRPFEVKTETRMDS
jgi:asparagine synthetase B (glutamine-hydrolysing)